MAEKYAQSDKNSETTLLNIGAVFNEVLNNQPSDYFEGNASILQNPQYNQEIKSQYTASNVQFHPSNEQYYQQCQFKDVPSHFQQSPLNICDNRQFQFQETSSSYEQIPPNTFVNQQWQLQDFPNYLQLNPANLQYNQHIQFQNGSSNIQCNFQDNETNYNSEKENYAHCSDFEKNLFVNNKIDDHTAGLRLGNQEQTIPGKVFIKL